MWLYYHDPCQINCISKKDSGIYTAQICVPGDGNLPFAWRTTDYDINIHGSDEASYLIDIMH